MMIRGMYFGACLGATAFEIQAHRLVVRILCPSCYFWPRRHFSCNGWVIPAVITFRITPKEPA
jgi:hypothetical protein